MQTIDDGGGRKERKPDLRGKEEWEIRLILHETPKVHKGGRKSFLVTAFVSDSGPAHFALGGRGVRCDFGIFAYLHLQALKQLHIDFALFNPLGQFTITELPGIF